MLKKIFSFLLILISILFFSTLHIGLTYMLPYPFSKLNVMFVFIILLIVWWESGWVVWVAFFSHILIELFSLTPFGVTLFAATITTLCTYWLYEAVITNRSSIATVFLCLLALLMYRAMYTLFLFGLSFFMGEPFPGIGFLVVTFSWELLFSALALIFFYIAGYPIIKNLRSQTLSLTDMYG